MLGESRPTFPSINRPASPLGSQSKSWKRKLYSSQLLILSYTDLLYYIQQQHQHQQHVRGGTSSSPLPLHRRRQVRLSRSWDRHLRRAYITLQRPATTWTASVFHSAQYVLRGGKPGLPFSASGRRDSLLCPRRVQVRKMLRRMPRRHLSQARPGQLNPKEKPK